MYTLDRTKVSIPFGFDWYGPHGPLPNGIPLDAVGPMGNDSDSVTFFRHEYGTKPFIKTYWSGMMWLDWDKPQPHPFRFVPIRQIYEGEDPWFYPVNPCGLPPNWYQNPEKNFEYDRDSFLPDIPWQTLDGIRVGAGWFLLLQPEEGPSANDFLFANFYYTLRRYNIPPEKTVYVTSNLIAKQCHDDYCNRHAVIRRVHIIETNYFEMQVGSRIEPIISDPTKFAQYDYWTSRSSIERPNRMLCYNRRPHWHRCEVVKNIWWNRDSFKSCLISFPSPSSWKESQFPVELPEDLVKSLPWMFDAPDLNVNLAFDGEVAQSFSQSYFSVVTETTMNDQTVFMSEKLWRPVMNFHPFLVVGNQYTLREFRKLGYKTFDLDESYDDEPDPMKRISMVMELAKTLCEMPWDKLHEWYWKQRDVLVHNRNHFLSRRYTLCQEFHNQLYDLLHNVQYLGR